VIKKLLASLLLSIFLLVSIFPKVASAQTWYSQGPLEWYTKVYDEAQSPQNEIFGERYTAAQVEWIIYTIVTWPFTKILGPEITTCALSTDVGTCITAIITDASPLPNLAALPKPKEEGLLKVMFKDKELSGVTYVKNVIRKFHLVPQAEAQAGFGFTEALLPIQAMWRASRDIAYGLFVVVALILAFMIMFRVKIAPQVVITAQSALPKILIAVVLVTFSYAIAGFIIDFMYVVIGLISLLAVNYFPDLLIKSIAPPLPPVITPTVIFNTLTLGQPLSLNFPSPYGIFGLFAFYLLLFALSGALVIGSSIGLIGIALTGAVGAALLLSVFPTAGLTAMLLLVGFILFLIVFIILLWMFFKTLFMLFKAYAGVILLTIFAPFQILVGTVVPSLGFGRWLRSFVANLAVFVVVGVLFLLAYIFAIQAMTFALLANGIQEDVILGILNGIFGTNIIGTAQNLFLGTSSAGWPPLLGTLGGSGDAAVSFLFLGVSFVLFTLIPKAADIIQGLISGRPFAYGTAIGEAFSPLAYPFGVAKGAAEKGVTGYVGEGYIKPWLQQRFGHGTPEVGRRGLGGKPLAE